MLRVQHQVLGLLSKFDKRCILLYPSIMLVQVQQYGDLQHRVIILNL